MNSFMNPQKNRTTEHANSTDWNFVESALVARHSPEVGPNPIRLKCPSCQKLITSVIESETYSKTHSCAAAFVLTIVCCPMIWVPYCFDWWKKKHHYCPSCRMYLGTYNG